MAKVKPDTLGNRAFIAREARRMKMADLTQAAGVSAGVLSRLELGKRGVSVETLVKVARALRVRLDWLATGLGPMEDTELVSTLPRRADAIRLCREDGVEEWAIMVVQARSTKPGDEYRSTLWWVDLIRAAQRERDAGSVTGVMRRIDLAATPPVGVEAMAAVPSVHRPRVRTRRKSFEPPPQK